MAITTAQRNSGYRQLGLLLAERYGTRVLLPLYRIIVKEVKDGLTQTQREIAKVVAKELFEAATGQAAVGNHAFKHLLMDQALAAIPDDPTTGVDHDDAFDAENITVI